MQSSNFDIAFLCGIFPEENYDDIVKNSKGNIQNASNELQKAYIDGLDKLNANTIKLINAPFIGSYPGSYKKLFVRRFEFSHSQYADDISVGFCNLSLINYFSKAKNLSREAFRWAKRNNGGKRKVLLAYSASYSMVKAISKIKKHFPDIITCLIVPDLPQYMTFSKHSKLWHFLVDNILVKPVMYNMKYVDTFIVLTKFFKNILHLEDKPYIVIEGIYNKHTELSINDDKDTNKRVLLYTGSLEQQYGIEDLINSFMLIDNMNYELWICGSGNAQDFVCDACNKDDRIKYFGQVSHQKSKALQMQADVLINPRSGLSGEYTYYSFPSKTIEYMASGKPVMLKKLPGIPDEYYNYVYVIPDGPVSIMSNYINHVLSLSDEELKQTGLKGKEFILNEKSTIVQCKKVIDMLDECIIK